MFMLRVSISIHFPLVLPSVSSFFFLLLCKDLNIFQKLVLKNVPALNIWGNLFMILSYMISRILLIFTSSPHFSYVLFKQLICSFIMFHMLPILICYHILHSCNSYLLSCSHIQVYLHDHVVEGLIGLAKHTQPPPYITHTSPATNQSTTILPLQMP